MMTKAVATNTLLLHFIVLIWGATGILGNEVELSSTQIVWWRVVLAVVALSLYAIMRGKSLTVKVKDIKDFALSGFLIGIHWLCFFEAIKQLNISLPLAIMGSTAFFVSLLSPLLNKQKPSRQDLLISVLAFVGLSVVLGIEEPQMIPAFLAIAAAILSATFAILNGRLVLKHDALKIGFWELIFAGLTMSVFIFIEGGGSVCFAFPKLRDLLLLAPLGIVCTAFAFVASIGVMKTLSPYTCCLAIAMEPVYTISFAAYWYGEKEKLSIGFYIGACLILLSLLLDAQLKQRETKMHELGQRPRHD
jgi:drug/metabolite transporter (DMT)-like permease